MKRRIKTWKQINKYNKLSTIMLFAKLKCKMKLEN